MFRNSNLRQIRVFLSFTVAVCLSLSFFVQYSCAGSTSGDIEKIGGYLPDGRYVPSKEWVSILKYRKKPPFKVMYSLNYSPFAWVAQSIEEFKAEAERYAIVKDASVMNANGDVAKQIADIEDAIVKGIDGIVVDDANADVLAPVISRVFEQGIPITVCGTPPKTRNYVAWRGIDQFEYGKIIAEWLVKEMKGEGNIIVLAGMAGTGVTKLRLSGAMSVIEKYPKVKIVAKEYAGWAYDSGKMATANLLSAHSNIDGVLSTGGAMTRGAIDAFVEAGRPIVPMTGEADNGFMKQWIKYSKQGFRSIAPFDPCWRSSMALEALLAVLVGKPVQKDIVLRVPLCTEENKEVDVRYDLPDSYWLGALLPKERIQKLYGGT